MALFNHAQVFLLLGAAITTVGVLAAALSLLRRRLDPLLLWFALFAILYGLRLDVDYQLLWALGLRPTVLRRIVLATQYLVPIPAFFFFRVMNPLWRLARIVCNIVWPIMLVLALLTLVIGPRDATQVANNIVVITALLVIVVELVRTRRRADSTLIRRALFLFIAFALYDNFSGLLGRYHYNVEPLGFMVLLGALGTVAGRRMLTKEQQLNEIHKELEIAQRIQHSILPAAFPVSDSFQVTARYLPMNTVAGDFYDFLIGTDDEAGLLISDVSGHGIPAALIASMVKLAAGSQRANAASPSAVLTEMNGTLCGQTQSQFVTAAYVYLNAGSRELRYAAAAHPPLLLLRSGEVVEIVENGLMLAVFDDAAYSSITLPIEPGDRLLLYTDGLLEAADAQEEEFGTGRFYAVVRETAGMPIGEAADRIIAAVQGWAAAQNDDLTIVICDFQP